jgi:prophage antirepressor-like protein
MDKIKLFENSEFGKIRVVMIDGNPWFVGKDVAGVLGYEKTRNAIARYVDAEDALKQGLLSDGGMQETIIINESGLYSLILSSKLPQAKSFKRWVTGEVLPSIRRTGQYIGGRQKSELPVPDELPNVEGHVYMPEFTVIANETVRRVTIEGQYYYCLHDILHAAGIAINHKSQMERKIIKAYKVRILTKERKLLHSYVSAEAIQVMFSRSIKKQAKQFLIDFTLYLSSSVPSVLSCKMKVDFERLLNIIIGMSIQSDREYLYELYKSLK